MMRLFSVGAVVFALLTPALDRDEDAIAKKRLQTFSKRETVQQRGAGPIPAHNAAIDDVPFAFAKVGKIRRLDRITITVTLYDADTDPDLGGQDVGDLILALDGIDTGIALDGFPGGETDTETIGGVPLNKAQILAALKADGELEASIVDADPGDNTLSVPADAAATLVLKGKQKRKW
jgi:hypothetical protein